MRSKHRKELVCLFFNWEAATNPTRQSFSNAVLAVFLSNAAILLGSMEGSYHVVPAARSALFAKSTIAS